MKFFEFIWYCIKCMAWGFSAMCGHVPKNYGFKEIFIGFATFVLITLLIFLILVFTGVIKFKK